MKNWNLHNSHYLDFFRCPSRHFIDITPLIYAQRFPQSRLHTGTVHSLASQYNAYYSNVYSASLSQWQHQWKSERVASTSAVSTRWVLPYTGGPLFCNFSDAWVLILSNNMILLSWKVLQNTILKKWLSDRHSKHFRPLNAPLRESVAITTCDAEWRNKRIYNDRKDRKN